MRKRATWIAACAIVLLFVALLFSRRRGEMTASLVNYTITNGQSWCVVLVSNGTGREYACYPGAEWSPDGNMWSADWQTHSARSEMFRLRSGESREAAIPLSVRGGKHRAKVHCAIPMVSAKGYLNWQYYKTQIMVLLGMKPASQVQDLRVDVKRE